MKNREESGVLSGPPQVAVSSGSAPETVSSSYWHWHGIPVAKVKVPWTWGAEEADSGRGGFPGADSDASLGIDNVVFDVSLSGVF